MCGIGHGTSIGRFSTLYWNVNVGGDAKIGLSTEIGAGAFIKQGTIIEDNCIIGAGAEKGSSGLHCGGSACKGID